MGKIDSRSAVTVVVTCKLITMISRFYHFMENRWENNENSERLYFLGYKITVGGDLKAFPPLLGGKAMTNLGSILASTHCFPSSHV